jgi:hypothetical protein
MAFDDRLNAAQFFTAEPPIVSKTHRIDSDFCGAIMAVDLQMRRFIWFVAEKMEPIRSLSPDGW